MVFRLLPSSRTLLSPSGSIAGLASSATRVVWRTQRGDVCSGPMVSETVVLRGHIIDSLILPKVLDQILTEGGDFKIGEIKIGQNRVDQSYARIEVSGPTHETLDEIVLRLRQHGAEVIEKADVQ